MIADPQAFILANTVLQPVPHAPQISLHLADEITPIWRMTEEALGESERAHVFNVCAPEARAAGPALLAYNASQQGLRGFSSALGLDFASQGIRVTTVFSPAKGALPDPAEAVAEAIFKAYQAGTAGEVDVTG